MSNIKLHSNGLVSFTSVPNIFIDKYMTNANGEYIKIYLYLLRCIESGNKSFSIMNMADIFEHTETDILRALHYWEKQKLIRLEFDSQKNLTGIGLINPYHLPSVNLSSPVLVSTVEPSKSDTFGGITSGYTEIYETDRIKSGQPEVNGGSRMAANLPKYKAPSPNKETYTLEQIEQFQDDEAVQEILFITENYLGRTLNVTDIRTIFYWYDRLNLSSDLIEYLIETCISNGHTSLRYMEKIALSWYENGITSVTQAKAEHALHSQSVYGVMNAFGISGRNLISSEISLVEKWTGTYGFSMDIIKEACQRTISSTGKASFEYADKILTNWHKNHVHNMNDVVKLDMAHKARSGTKVKEGRERISVTGSKFHNFPQRTYNYDKLETQLLNSSSS